MNYVLVHGAWEGSWAWESVVPLLEEQGHRTLVVDLPGSWGRPSPVSDVSMDGYISVVIDAVDQAQGKVVLAGHSMAGAVISAVAERIPDRIERLIYVAAFLLESGGSVLGAMKSDEQGQLLSQLDFSQDESYATVSNDVWRQVGFHDVPEAGIERALPRLSERQATEPFVAAVELTKARFGSIPKTFLRTTLDKIASPQLQDAMIANWFVEKVEHLESGHFPALAIPRQLALAMQ